MIQMKTGQEPGKIQVQTDATSAQVVNQDQRVVRGGEENQELEGRVGPREVENFEGRQGKGLAPSVGKLR